MFVFFFLKKKLYLFRTVLKKFVRKLEEEISWKIIVLNKKERLYILKTSSKYKVIVILTL